ncbi:hypothetical protein K505DRAFT_327567 [Melanomma pulvis-pyrius CBS 109.77]|uniref:EthD domain-containing protein n=1 Tax=Melanomma pulvis-pyrius CBS 109.77 TaxID=1314802 RepID=A0A6A6X3H5_9PLEO|nr:hypothetical protein K505DRAFT_327567 [Melanomma pulvis-pyrius CBS 109.77]
MPFTIAAFVTRKPDISPVDFKSAYEKHLSILKEATGDSYADSVTRHYVKRVKADPTGEKPLTFTGSEQTFGYDLVVFFTFADEAAAGVFQEKYGAAQEKIAGDAGAFAQLDKFRVIGFEDAISS